MKTYRVENISLNQEDLRLQETLFHNANGYIGVRGNFEEGYPDQYDTVRGQYINGFYDFVSMPQAEKLCGLTEEKQTMLNVADTQGIRLFIDGEPFSLFDGKILEKNRTLEMEKGVTIREILWETKGGKRIKIEIKRMTSFIVLPLFLIDYKVTPIDCKARIEMVSTHIGEVINYFNPSDPRVAGEAFQYIIAGDIQIKEGNSFITASTSRSGLTVCSGVRNVFSEKGEQKLRQNNNRAEETFKAELAENKTLTLLKYSILCDSIRYADPVLSAQQIMKQVISSPVESLYKGQELYLKEFWENSAIEIEGEEELNAAIHYNLYQLMQSAGRDAHSNIAAKGLSGEGYEGHYFWDTEMYMQPFFILNARDIAKNLIQYRYTILDYAKENARILGHKKGAAYPWRTIMGKECSGYFPSGSAQYHISGDIAYSIISYYLATKDLDLLARCGAEILIETARLWMDLGNYYKDQFHINEVTGPDEYTCLVNNNYYTNVLAKYNLRWAAESIRLLKETGLETMVLKKTKVTKEELAAFREASEKMYLPYDKTLGINPQDDSFLQKKMWDISKITEEEKPLLLHYHPMYLYRFQVCKQADTVLAHFILEDEQDIETIRKSFAYYEKVTTHDSSLSTCIYSIMASRLGLEDKAYEYFGESAKLDLFNTHKNTKDGIHTANMGGTYMAIVYGFGGLRIKESGLSLHPVLPKKWKNYKFRFLYEDAKIEVSVTKEGCELTLLQGTEKNITIYGEEKRLTDRIKIDR